MIVAPSRDAPLLEARALGLALPLGRGLVPVVEDVSFTLRRGEAVGLVGESGAGKSMTALALAGLQPDGARVVGEVRLGGAPLPLADDRAMSAVRGRRIGVVFQEPMSALNPVRPIGAQVAEPLLVHGLASRADAETQAAELLEQVGLAAAGVGPSRFPHELSGGQRQRVALAIALACGPDLVVADEPTTALDMLSQARVLDLLERLAEARGAGLVLVSHDLGVISERTDRVLVMVRGRVVEAGPTREVLAAPAHPYTRGLLAAMPPRDFAAPRPARLATIPGQMPPLGAPRTPCPFEPRCPLAAPACRDGPPRVDLGGGREALCARLDVAHLAFGGAVPGVASVDPARRTTPSGRDEGTPAPARQAPLLRIEGLARRYPAATATPTLAAAVARRLGLAPQPTRAVLDGVDLEVRAGESVGLVGASGSGKSTLARLVLGLDRADEGRILFDGRDAAAPGEAGRAALAALRRRVSIVFQDPFGSLDPRWSVEAIVAEPLRAAEPNLAADAARRRVVARLNEVGLGADALPRQPHAFSGGQRQRIALARALVTDPDLVIADEAVSALDLSIQAQILNLLEDLRVSRHFACLFITHDLSVVAQATERLLVLDAGRIVERGPTREVLAAPRHAATRALVAALPRLGAGRRQRP